MNDTQDVLGEVRGQASVTREGHPEEACRECGGANVVWFAPNEVWNAVMESESGILCPVCFIMKADTKGLYQTGGWRVTPEAPDSHEQTIQAAEKLAEALKDIGCLTPHICVFGYTHSLCLRCAALAQYADTQKTRS